MLLALRLLRRLLDLACPGGALERRELCLFMGGMKGSAPGMVSSVRPARELGARAMEEGDSGSMIEGDETWRAVGGGVVHMTPG
jgi:hypothetical protein